MIGTQTHESRGGMRPVQRGKDERDCMLTNELQSRLPDACLSFTLWETEQNFSLGDVSYLDLI